MAYNPTIALELLKGRMDRAGLSVPPGLAEYWNGRLDAAADKLQKNGVVFDDDENSIPDNELIADYAAYMLKNRDSAEQMPKWLRLEIRERFLQGKRNVL